MAVQSTKSVLAGKLQAKTVEEATKGKSAPIQTGLQRLPGGIMNGVAKLVEIGFFETKADSKAKKADGTPAVGEAYFRAAGVVMSPDGVPQPDGTIAKCGGLQTTELWGIYDTMRGGKLHTQHDAVLKAMNCMKALVNNPKLFDQYPVVNGDVLEAVAAAIRSGYIGEGKKPLYFRFTTEQGKPTKQYPTPMVFENWRGSEGMTNWQPPSARLAVQDTNPASPAASNGTTQHQQPAAATQHEPEPEHYDHVPEPESAEIDLDALVRQANMGAADPGTKPAQDRLIALAVAAGRSQQEAEDAQAWQDVAEMAKAGTATTPTTNGVVGPVVGDTWRFTKAPYVDPKTKQHVAGRYRSVDVEVMEARPDGTFSVANVDNPAQRYVAAVADLEPA